MIPGVHSYGVIPTARAYEVWRFKPHRSAGPNGGRCEAEKLCECQLEYRAVFLADALNHNARETRRDAKGDRGDKAA